MDYKFEHNPDQQQFVLLVGSEKALIDYTRDGDVLNLTHTLVPSSLRGQGIAKILLEKSLQEIRDKELKAKPVCSYIVLYAERNGKKWQDVLV